MKRRRIDAPRAWGVQLSSGRVDHFAFPDCIEPTEGHGINHVGKLEKKIRVRVLRESDYRKLLKEARRK